MAMFSQSAGRSLHRLSNRGHGTRRRLDMYWPLQMPFEQDQMKEDDVFDDEEGEKLDDDFFDDDDDDDD
jgi:hypothetical protein